MKVLMINGSPHKNGTTAAALGEIAKEFNSLGVESEMFHIGSEPVQPCVGCEVCGGSGGCIFDDAVSLAQKKMHDSDGLIIASPVYYAAPSGALITFLNRMFYSGAKREDFEYKPGAAVAVARRAGTTSALDVLNKYFGVSGMPIVSSQYWNMVFGEEAADAPLDTEGMQIMRTLAQNMTWLMRCIKAGSEHGIDPPVPEPRVCRNFIDNRPLT